MHHLESAAKQQELTTIRLETRAKLTAAAILYTRFGYTPTGPFGEYIPSPTAATTKNTSRHRPPASLS